MKSLLTLATKSLWHRRETVLLTILSLALSLFLLLSVERLRESAEKGFTQTISQTDLIVGARTGPTNLVLATVFNRGTFTNNIKESSYQHWAKHPAVEWTIPFVLGDGHRSYRVVGTTDAFFKHYRYQGQRALALKEGSWTLLNHEMVIGSELAQRLGYRLGQQVVVEHGVTRDVGLLHHDDHPYKVAGILESTGTIIDQSLFVSIDSLAAMHEEERIKTPAAHSKATPPDASPQKGAHHHDDEDHDAHAVEAHQGEDHVSRELTGFFLRLKNRVDILTLQREINTDTSEPLTAVIPSVAVNEIWQTLGVVENALRLLGYCILGVSLLSMMSILLATLNERRREMAILRALGARPGLLAGLLVIESSLITMVSVAVGVILQRVAIASVQGLVREKYGLFLEAGAWSGSELQSVGLILVLGVLVGFLPAARVYRSTLKDGLAVK